MPNCSVEHAAICPDGRRVALVVPNDQVMTWDAPDEYLSGVYDVPTGRQVLQFQQRDRALHAEGSYRRVAFSPDGRRIAVGYTEFAAVWDVPVQVPPPPQSGDE